VGGVFVLFFCFGLVSLCFEKYTLPNSQSVSEDDVHSTQRAHTHSRQPQPVVGRLGVLEEKGGCCFFSQKTVAAAARINTHADDGMGKATEKRKKREGK
jgi:hypothetical protein